MSTLISLGNRLDMCVYPFDIHNCLHKINETLILVINSFVYLSYNYSNITKISQLIESTIAIFDFQLVRFNKKELNYDNSIILYLNANTYRLRQLVANVDKSGVRTHEAYAIRT